MTDGPTGPDQATPQFRQSQGGPAEKLNTLLGFDVTKATRLTSEFFGEVVAEIAKERTDIAKGKAKELLTKAISLREQASKAGKDFAAQMKKFDKELTKVIGSVQGILDGRSPQEGDEEKE